MFSFCHAEALPGRHRDTVAGTYRDELIRTSAGWHISKREIMA
jgi:hypothetical protein